ncbi:hypothetical protein JXA80_11750, partial [bacterium]|nr:hypothetical protein [candidate division CSSED10-310 bacterium]
MNRRYACRILAVGMPAAVAVSALFPVTAGWFFADDFYWLQFAGSAGSSPVDLLTHRFFNYYRPVINCLFRLEYTWAHLNAAPRYVLNLVMYAASTGLLVAWLNRLTGRIPIAVATGVLFGLGARHVEAVTWISGRTDLTAVLFFLTAMLLIPPLEAFPSPQRASGRFRTCLSVAALICAGLSKETPVVTPLIIYLVDRRESPVHPRLLHWFHSRMPWIATGIALTVLHTVMQSIGNVAWTRLGPPITLMGAAKNLIGGTALAALQNVPSWFRWDGNGWIACSILALVA